MLSDKMLFTNKTLLITGGTGSFGNAVLNRFLATDIGEIRIFSRDEKIEAIHMLPGYTHNIINLSDTEDLVTLMWANEQFDPNQPDTFGEIV